jgi:hypothetical protein
MVDSAITEILIFCRICSEWFFTIGLNPVRVAESVLAADPVI